MAVDSDVFVSGVTFVIIKLYRRPVSTATAADGVTRCDKQQMQEVVLLVYSGCCAVEIGVQCGCERIQTADRL